ncbi:hypothetical protein [Anaeromyxobacter oryzae]|uniref:DUF2378 family protein n=1 Tax=Anaeromyxobacter oryzae TaxID=2918170 RepID=A0ABN6MZ43_9BACT|nr:hypothetical protein [Anaeromyxobacter oryzae]BDG06215.1 hypothetical protein AMOR_52110 [Anaeromyxobacter oryzae]
MPQRTLPRLERFVAGLAGGLDAFPSALAKGALVRNLLEDEPLPEILPALPEPLRRLATEPPVGSEWIPEAHFDALVLAVADARGLTDAELLSWTRARNLRLFSSPAYRILMAVMSPAQLLRFAGARWTNWHRGTTLEVEGIADDGVMASLRYPRGLFDPTILRVYGEAFTAALQMANAKEPAVTVVAEQPGLARYRASWS